ncbi:MAG: selenocysteine-specific translation elongation factor [Candidatus Neomarinimicrobiota bacterium]
MAQFVIGTAGHIDHGKTALVKALTGVDTDRLAEEKARGMTIDLGFAFLTDAITIIDVPGHERFIRNMVAGVSTIHLALLVIAADDGVMPQTIEHLNILKLLGIPRGIIVITKVDLAADPDWLDLVEAEIGELVAGTFLETAPIIRTSTATTAGIEELRQLIIAAATTAVAATDRGFFRHQVDRVFIKKGFGAVVTGTVISGQAAVGNDVRILPGDLKAKIRSLQSHGVEVDTVAIGDRAAINLAGTDSDRIVRGSELTTPGWLNAGTVFIARITLLPGSRWQVKKNQRVHLHIGTAEVLARLSPLATRLLEAGQSANALVACEQPVVAAMDDRFVIRSYSPMETIGGGLVLDPEPKLRGRALRDWAGRLSAAMPERFGQFVGRERTNPRTVGLWVRRFHLSEATVRSLCSQLGLLNIPDNDIVYEAGNLAAGRTALLDYLAGYHRKNPYRRIVSREAIRGELNFSPPWFDFVVQGLIADGHVIRGSGGIALADHSVDLAPGDRRTADRIVALLLAGRFAPPTLAELPELTTQLPAKIFELLHILKEQGTAVEVQSGLWFHADRICELVNLLKNHFRQTAELDVGTFKDLTGTTRKTAIPLLEYCDNNNFTIRSGYNRVAGRGLV